MPVTTTSEAQCLVEQFDPAALAAAAAAPDPAVPEAPEPIKRSSRTSILALSVCALAINGSAAIYTLPSDFSSLSIGSLAEMLPRLEAYAPKPDPVIVALKEIQSAQQQHTASLLENNRVLQQNAARTQQDSTVLLSLRQSVTDERVDVKKVSSQLSTLIAKVDSLQNVMVSDVTSSIRRANARYGLSAAMRKRMVRQSKSAGPVSVGGAPLSVPATVSAPES
ncbi:hypothetical protein ACQ86E_32120 [Bradyrhizobium betae]|jgi:hypothetical protein|uniref:hypothetical protein n=1 Tax=Bradyrhizobium betae TaxID=244734 RepID=UPI003D66D1DD